MKNILLSCLFLATIHLCAQTETDGLMMPKKNLCTGFIFQNSNWNQYWEGTFKRENQNLGTVSTNSYVANANYGLTDKANIIVGANYITTEASAGSLKGQNGFQNISATLKYKALEKSNKNNTFQLITSAGFSVPMTNYVVDYLPLSIGLGNKEAVFRIMGDYQVGKITATLSGAYIHRANIKIDRDAYYTTEYHYTNEVFMPDVFSNIIRVGYRSDWFIADIAYDNMLTLGKTFDITNNNMPFPSNTMNQSKIGINAKYELKSVSGLAFVGGYSHVLDGRNVGQSKNFYTGVFYNINFNKEK
jgi:hypothetical protein